MIEWLIGSAALVAGSVLARVLYLKRDRFDHLRHFGVVREGVLYRCGQPDGTDLEAIHQRVGLKTVVSLRGGIDNPRRNAWAEPEKRFCEARGILFVSLPSNHKNPPDRRQVREFLDLVSDPARRPVLVHCKRGQQRTGLFCAFYRMACEGWSREQALAEMEALGFGLEKRRHRLLREVLEKCSVELTGLVGSP